MSFENFKGRLIIVNKNTLKKMSNFALRIATTTKKKVITMQRITKNVGKSKGQ